MQAASLLLEAGADVNARNGKRSITPIMIAGAVGHFTLLEVMASHHTANVNIQVQYQEHIKPQSDEGACTVRSSCVFFQIPRWQSFSKPFTEWHTISAKLMALPRIARG